MLPRITANMKRIPTHRSNFIWRVDSSISERMNIFELPHISNSLEPLNRGIRASNNLVCVSACHGIKGRPVIREK